MRRILLILIIALIPIVYLSAQKKIVDRPINFSDQNQIAPNLSFDGKELVYLTDHSNDGQMILMHSKKAEGSWSRPKEITVFNSTSERNYIGGYFFSGDGKSLFYTVPKYGGMGGYDIWYSEKVSGKWETPKNIGKPINSKLHDGSPSLSPDGQTIFFMRCEKMDRKQAKNCNLFVAKKVGRKWSEAQKLPDHINAGGAIHPRIQVDGKTLVFAREGEEQNLFQTKLINGQWSQPKALNFLNTGDAHEAFYTTDASAKVAWFSTKFRGKYVLAKAPIPAEFKIEPIHFIKGNLQRSRDQSSIQAAVLVYDSESRAMLRREKISKDGQFYLILDQSKTLDVSVVDFQMKRPYEELQLIKSLSNESTYSEMIVDFDSEPDFIDLKNISWNIDRTDISNTSEIAILRLVKYLKRNRNLSWFLNEPAPFVQDAGIVTNEEAVESDDWPSMWEDSVETPLTENEWIDKEETTVVEDAIEMDSSQQTLVDLIYSRLEAYDLYPSQLTLPENKSSQGSHLRLVFRKEKADTFKFE